MIVLAREEFENQLKSFWQEQITADPLYRMRLKAWKRYEELGLPTRKTEVFRYLSMNKFFANEYAPAAPSSASLKGPFISFVNGFYADSNVAGVVVLPLKEAIKSYGGFIQNQWDQSVAEEKDPFAALNGALHGEGVFIYVPPNTKLEEPIELLQIIDSGDVPMMLQPRIHIFVSKHAEVNFISREKKLNASLYGINGFISFSLDEASHVTYTQSILDEGVDVWHFESVRATLKQNSTLKTILATDGSGTVRHDYKVLLNGENSEVFLNGVLMLGETREAHINILVEHVAPNCRSNQLFKHALSGSSKSSFEGKIYVHEEAQKTEAFQLNQNLVLSDGANAYSKPNLEIFADDVKASHGATVGQLNEEQLFYLKTRGFSALQAKNLLIYGFCKEVVDMIQDESLLREVTARAKRYLTEKGVCSV